MEKLVKKRNIQMAVKRKIKLLSLLMKEVANHIGGVRAKLSRALQKHFRNLLSLSLSLLFVLMLFVQINRIRSGRRFKIVLSKLQ